MPKLADKISRKWALTVVAVIFNIRAIIETAAPSYAVLIVGRTIGGIGVGTLAMVRSATIAIVTADLTFFREHHCTFLRFHLPIFEAHSFGTRHIASEASFRVPFALQMLCSTILGFAIHLFPYSPR